MKRRIRTPESQNERTKIGIPCPNCREHFEQTVTWFQANDVARCAACGEAFSLRTKETQAYIQQLAQIGDAFDAANKKRP
jgi:uncharacterized Zn finger protein